MENKEFIKIRLRSGKEYSLEKSVAEAIIDSKSQMPKLTKDGVWTGDAINKSEIILVEPDREEERRWREKHQIKLPEGKGDTTETRKAVTQRMIDNGVLPPNFRVTQPTPPVSYRD